LKPDDAYARNVLTALVKMYEDLGRPEEAAKWRTEEAAATRPAASKPAAARAN
jgi:hypothetical protein